MKGLGLRAHAHRWAWLCLGGLLFAAAPSGAAPEGELFRVRASDGGLPVVEWDREAVRGAAARGTPVLLRGFPLRAGRSVDLELAPFSVTRPDTRIVRGRRAGPDRSLPFDSASVALFRGRVVGEPGSRVVLALRAGQYTGSIELGAGGERYRLASRGAGGRLLGGRRSAVFAATRPPELPPGVPLCGLDALQDGDSSSAVSTPLAPAPLAATAPSTGLKTLELAVETDHEYYQLFDDPNDAAAYLVSLYGQVSDVYLRDHGVRVELVFARLWDDPDDLFNDVDPSPLPDFRSYWNANMGAVQRDAAQLLSGRRDYPFGGQAYLSALCGTSAYSVVGYALGFFPDPSLPSPYSYDISVTAHELGHNSGTGHTHDSPNFVDECDDPLSTPQRGTIMSYCGQTWSGGNSNRDLYFHSRIQQNIDAHVGAASCVVDDCNLNGVADASDIAGATSPDANTNGVPDECEDCNGNAVLDDDDIQFGSSADVDADGVPDECQPDCNANGVPDAKDIADGASDDAYGNELPDECELDCNSNGVSDYTEIQLDMPLDVDRNAVLDACQDCDADGTPDRTELGGAHDLWLASGLAGSDLREFYATTGVHVRTSSGATLARAQDLIVAPDGRVLVSSADDDRVVAFDPNGSYLGDLVTAGSGGLDLPGGLLWRSDGTLLVTSQKSDSVLAYDGTSGAPLGAFVPTGSGGLSAPSGLSFGPNGNLFVVSGGNEVLEYDGASGAFVGSFVSAADNGGLDSAKGLVFKSDGNLLVASYGSDQTVEFDGRTGASLGRWAQSGTATALTQSSPWGIRIGPNGNVFIVRTGEAFGSGGGGSDDHDHDELHLTNAQMYEFDVASGLFLRAHINGNDHGTEFPTGFDFRGGWQRDCNLNQQPDSCDIASGFSLDLDLGGVPDECELDCNANGALDRLDIIPYGASFDCNWNRVPDECEAPLATPGICADPEPSCDDGFDNDRDGLPDCADPDCQGTALCPGETVFFDRFDADETPYGYVDDAFRGTSQPAYASGSYLPAGGFSGGGLAVDVGGVDGTTVLGMSGGWTRTFSLAAAGTAELYLRFDLEQAGTYESDEISQVMVSLDGVALGPGGDDFLAQVAGDGNSGPPIGTGWTQLSLDLGELAAGAHTLTIGAYNNKKTLANESTRVRIDDVLLTATCEGGPDADADGRPDVCDNCPNTPNPLQEDAGGIGDGSGPDGVGNACQCGDVDGDGRVALPDIALYRIALADPSGTPLTPQAQTLCTVFGPAGECGVRQVGVLRRELEGPGLGPGIAQACSAAVAP